MQTKPDGYIIEKREVFDKRMCKTYPTIFRQRALPKTQTPMYYGFSVGGGWFHLIEDVCKKIDIIQRITNVSAEATQIKEKFGTLRFYIQSIVLPGCVLSENEIHHIHEVIQCIVSQAERHTCHVCEQCGEYGSERGGSWIRTLCDECHTKKLEEDEDKMNTPYGL